MRRTLVLLAVMACDSPEPTRAPEPAPERKPEPARERDRIPARPTPVDPSKLPDLTLTTIDNTPLATKDLLGKVTLLLVWASWCEPCTQEGPSLNDVYFRRKADINLVGISRDEADAAAMRAFRDRHHIRYPVILATDDLLAKLGNPTEIPTFLLYDRTGKLIWTMSGSLPAPILERELDAALEAN